MVFGIKNATVLSDRVVLLDDITKRRHIKRRVLVSGEIITFLRIEPYPDSHYIDEPERVREPIRRPANFKIGGYDAIVHKRQK